MVRLSLVNLYLHDFREPHIFEYDTLTSEERWNEYADVILANPPFMSPKGGIRPHRRFSVQSKRSEVLFVDYIAEHLTPTGRAGIIVPEGIIFQSQTAHKQLRKMLVENYLVAVISLPAGVFQPYSGVKTSILLLDKALAQKTDRIAFFKVENDGFDLGAQRREIAENDLPRVREELGEYLGRLRVGESVLTDGVAEPRVDYMTELGLIAEKEKIAEDGEYNLSGERYRENRTDNTKYEWVELGDIILGKPEYGSGARKVPYDSKVRYVRITDITDNGELKSDDLVSPSVIESDLFLKPNDLLIARSGSVGRTYIHEDLPGIYQYAGYLIRFRINPAQAIPKYIYHVTKSDSWREWILSNSKTGTLTNINAKQYSAFRFPLPPLEVQREIVAEIEGYQRVIGGARAVIDNYRPQIVVDPEWPMVELGDAAELTGGYAFKSTKMTATQLDATDRLVVKIGNVGRDGYLEMEKAQFHPYSDHLARFKLHKDDVVVAMTGATVGKVAVVEEDGFLLNQRVGVLRAKSTAIQRYIFYLSSVVEFYNYCQQTAGGGAQGNIAPREILKYKIPLPPTETQQEIVAEIEAEQSLVAANRELVKRMEGKIRAAIGRVWGDEGMTDVSS